MNTLALVFAIWAAGSLQPARDPLAAVRQMVADAREEIEAFEKKHHEEMPWLA